MINYIEYDAVSGRILCCASHAPGSMAGRAVLATEHYNEKTHTHVINGGLSSDTSIVIAAAMTAVRRTRNIKMAECDWTQSADSPLSASKKLEWASYRQALRDFPDNCDVFNPIWPIAPTKG